MPASAAVAYNSSHIIPYTLGRTYYHWLNWLCGVQLRIIYSLLHPVLYPQSHLQPYSISPAKRSPLQRSRRTAHTAPCSSRPILLSGNKLFRHRSLKRTPKQPLTATKEGEETEPPSTLPRLLICPQAESCAGVITRYSPFATAATMRSRGKIVYRVQTHLHARARARGSSIILYREKSAKLCSRKGFVHWELRVCGFDCSEFVWQLIRRFGMDEDERFC